MTVKELRKNLFEVVDQEMTVKELRAALFEIEDQDMQVEEFIKILNRTKKYFNK